MIGGKKKRISGIFIFVLLIALGAGVRKARATCVYSEVNKSRETLGSSYCDTQEAQVIALDSTCGHVTLELPGDCYVGGPTEGCIGSVGINILNCGSDSFGFYCNCQAWACDAACGGGDDGGGDTCGDQSQPSCSQGTCSNGRVCVGTGNQGLCGCSNGATCADVVGEPQNLAATRTSPTSATVTWTAPWWQYVTGQRMVIGTGNEAGNCIVWDTDCDQVKVDFYTTDKTVGQYDAVGLDAGTYYWVYVKFYTNVPKGQGQFCSELSRIQYLYLSSCLLTPNPANIAVGETVTLTSGVNEFAFPNWFRDHFSLVNGGVAAGWAGGVNPNPDTTHPYSINVTGQADGIENVSGVIMARVGSGANEQWVPICGDTTSVHVGCLSSAPTAPTLVAPSDGATLSAIDVTLDWNATSSWGAGCPSNNNTYRVYLNKFSPPTTQIASVGSGTTASNFTGEFGKTYYWRVGVDNGSLEALSSIRSFTITAPIVTSEAWWQAMGAGVYAGSTANQVTIKSLLPTVDDRLILPGVVGTAAAAVRVAGWTDFGSGSISDDGWSAKSTYKGKTMDYKYFAAQIGVTGLRRLL